MRLRVEISLEIGNDLKCVGQPSEREVETSFLHRAMRGARSTLCWLGFHNLAEIEEKSCCWGGVDQCTRCGKEVLWSNSYR